VHGVVPITGFPMRGLLPGQQLEVTGASYRKLCGSGYRVVPSCCSVKVMSLSTISLRKWHMHVTMSLPLNMVCGVWQAAGCSPDSSQKCIPLFVRQQEAKQHLDSVRSPALPAMPVTQVGGFIAEGHQAVAATSEWVVPRGGIMCWVFLCWVGSVIPPFEI
jgi:hypothetical protein